MKITIGKFKTSIQFTQGLMDDKMKDLDKEVDEKMKKIKEINKYWKKQVGLKEKLRTLEDETIFV